MTTIIKYAITVTLVFGILPLITAQTVEEIIDKHIKAHGGIEKWEKVESMKITGKFTAFSIEDDFLAIKTKDGHYYSELSLGDKRVVEAFKTADEEKVVIPANWPKNELIGRQVIIPPATDEKLAEERVKEYSNYDWWFCYKSLEYEK